jgi:hypothetical protein
MQAISRVIRFNTSNNIKIFKIFSIPEIFKLLINFKKKRIIINLLSQTNVSQISTILYELRLFNSINEKKKIIDDEKIINFNKNYFDLFFK